MKTVTRTPARNDTEEQRRRRRALIRAHHPDRGGDAAEFIRLLHQLAGERASSASCPEVSFVRRRGWWQGAVSSIPLFRRTSRRPQRVI